MHHVREEFESEAPRKPSRESAQHRTFESRFGRKDARKQKNQEGRKKANATKKVEDEELSQKADGEVEFEKKI